MTETQELQLISNEVYYIYTSHENGRPYIYEGLAQNKHSFFRRGAIINTMRRIFVSQKDLEKKISDRYIGIKEDNYLLDGITKEDNPEEYSRLEKLWKSKQK